MLSHFQPARRPRRDLSHRTSSIHTRVRTLSATRGRGVSRIAQEAGVSDGCSFSRQEEAGLGGAEEKNPQSARSGKPAREMSHRGLPPKIPTSLCGVFRDAPPLLASMAVPWCHFRIPRAVFASPRRLAVLIENVANKATDMHADTSGPSVAAAQRRQKVLQRKYWPHSRCAQARANREGGSLCREAYTKRRTA